MGCQGWLGCARAVGCCWVPAADVGMTGGWRAEGREAPGVAWVRTRGWVLLGPGCGRRDDGGDRGGVRGVWVRGCGSTRSPSTSSGQALWKTADRPLRQAQGRLTTNGWGGGIKVYERPTRWTARVRGFPGTAIAVPECHATFIGRSPHIRQRSKSHDWHHPYASPPQRFGFLGTTPMSGMGPLCTKRGVVGLFFRACGGGSGSCCLTTNGNSGLGSRRTSRAA